MARTLLSIMALVALLALSACNSVTGPDTESNRGATTVGGKDRSPLQFDSPDTVTPGEGENSGSDHHPLNRIRVRRQPHDRDREEVAPDEGAGGGGGDNGSGITEEQAPPRRGKDVVTPGN